MRGGRGQGIRVPAPPSAALLALLLPASVPADLSTSVTADMHLGYDSNPAQRQQAEALGFVRYGLDALARKTLDGSDLELAAGGWHRDYEGANDSQRATLRGGWRVPLEDDRALLTLSLEGALYRDQLVPADERDEAAASVRYDRLLSARDEVGLFGEYRWLDYRNPSLPWAGRPGGPGGPMSRRGPSPGGPPGGMPPPEPAARDDGLATLELDATRHWSPDLATLLSLRYARRESTVMSEAYDHYGAGLVARLAPRPGWRLELGVGWYRTSYDSPPGGPERDDDRLSAGLSLGRDIGDGQVSCDLAYLDNASTLDVKSFRQTVTQCGLAWTF